MRWFLRRIMKLDMPEPKENNQIYKIALLVAISCVLQISESLIPHPIPGLRLGMANMVTLVALVVLGFRPALEIAIFRTILSSIIMGTFMSPTFVLSLSGALISTLVMGFLYWLAGFNKVYRLSIIGISIVGALVHNLVQLYLAYLILVKHGGIFIFLPWLCIGAVVMGWVTGAVAGGVCRRLEKIQKKEMAPAVIQQDFSAPGPNTYQAGASFLHRLPVEIKLTTISILLLTVIIFNNFWLYLGLYSFLAVIVVFSHTSFTFLFSKAKRYTSLLLVAFFLPLFFNSGTQVVFDTAYFRITHEGLNTGALFASRILFLILVSSLLVRTTSPGELTRGLARVLSPLKYLGVPEKKIATILSLSWTAVPFFWEEARKTIRATNLKKVEGLRNLIPALSHLVATLYADAAPGSAYWKTAYPGRKENLNVQDTVGRG
jgi:heptaprenyl diphosphate synthase